MAKKGKGDGMTEQEVKLRMVTLARAACKRHDEIEAALEYMLAKIGKDADLFKELVEEAMRSASLRAIYLVRHHDKGDMKAAACGRGPETVGAVGNCLTTFLERWLLPDGRPLSDAKGEELPELAASEYALAHGHENNATFYRTLAQRVKPNQRVGSVVKSQDAAALWNEIAGPDAEAAAA